MNEKHSGRRLLALIMACVLSLSLVVPASAAGNGNSRNQGSSSQTGSNKGGKGQGGSSNQGGKGQGRSSNQGGKGQGSSSNQGSNSQTDSSSSEDAVMTLVEDDTTVAEGTELRASTYVLTNPSADTGVMPLADDGSTTTTGTTIKYFPVTMYNYDRTTINNATHQAEVDSGESTQWNGIYFSDGNPTAEPYSEGLSIEDGTYILKNARAAANNVGSWLVGNTSGITSTTNQSDATRWTIQKNSDGTYTLNSANGYMTIGEGENGEKTTTTASNIEIVEYSGVTYTGCVQFKSGSYYLCQWGGKDATIYGGYNVENDAGNAFYLYKVTDSGTEQVTFDLPYAAWNFWTGHLSKDSETSVSATRIEGANGNYLYSGLVESTLDANKNIVFTKPEGGIFNSDASVKTIYTNVELPFIYDNGTYTFDASQNGVYFHEDSTQGSTTAQSNGRLYQGTTQSISDLNAEDGSNTVFMPFDDATAISSTSVADYWFGMAATVPFTMTTNGRLKQGDDNSDPITFSFSGDDDVWVFIDGQLVIDLGGIHNRLDATIDFAANTVTYEETNDATGTMGDAAGTLDVTATQTLFGGLISQDRTTFAATDSHELTIFYLERGGGSSNCKIQFNLPMKDTLTVHKIVDKTDLTEQELAQVGNLNFNFTLYKKDAETGEFSPVVNTTYSLLNANGQVISTPSTSATGRFILQDGQTAKFVGALNTTTTGDTYYVVEDAVDGFNAPTYAYTAQVAGGATHTDSTDQWTSMTINAIGSDEAEDHISIDCTNTLKADRPNPSATPGEDWIVVDYGLSVVIDPLHNDLWRGNSIELTGIGGAPTYDTDGTTITGYADAPVFGTATQNGDGTITYQLTKQLSQVDVLTYKVTVSGNNTTADAYGLIYIIPATSMYYEENFSDMVTYADGKSSGWTVEGSPEIAPQETGYVRATDTAPYGSDPAYLNDSGDSNGSSMYVNTTNGAAGFCYTFTGTGTSFFARTSANSGYFKVEVFNGESAAGTAMLTRFVDTKYVATNDTTIDGGTLYNIPVFTYEADNYGIYTVRVTIFKASETCGSEFYLDGIRVINPLFDPANPGDLTATEQIAQTAYSADGEANMTVVTLRQKLIGEAQIDEDDTISWNEGDNFVLFTDSNGAITTAEEYKSNGPKEEVYLNEGQSVTFSLTNWDPNTNKIYLGIKAPVGSGTVSINGNTLNINNATDCYYDISSYATITTDEYGVKTATFEIKATSSLISVTNIKVTGNAQFTIVLETDVDVSGDIEDSGEG